MSQLLDAAAGVPNASEPIPGIVTGGQPSAAHLDALRRAGLEYLNIPVSHGPLADATFDAVRATVRGLAGKKRVLFYCGSGNRVGVMLLPYFMLDRGMPEDEAVTEAMRVGMRSAGLMEEALDYVKRKTVSR